MSIKNMLLTTAATASLLLLVSAPAAFAQQSKAQQKCLNLMNTDGAAVAKQQSSESAGCLKAKATGKLIGTAQSCLTADAKGKLLKKKNKTAADDTKNCAVPPSFGYTGAAAVNAGAVQAELDLGTDVFGPTLDPAVVSCSSNKNGCACQQKVFGDVTKLADKKLGEFRKCKAKTLKAGASTANSLSACVESSGTPGSIAADTKGAIAKGLKTLNTDIDKKCDAKGVTAVAFPGDCTGLAGTALGTCLDVQVECRVCQAINDIDGLFVNCDLFDDQTANGSCASGTGPTPTPSPGPTPTPTPHVGTVLIGSLTATNGRFNYNLTLGLPGANAACNTNFAGTHACTYAELQSAATAGDLVGLKDTANHTVTSFWAIDNAQPILQQCNDDVSSGLNWEYGTQHTGSRGQKVGLTNATGVLGSLQSGLQCNLSGMSWVGCCQ